MVIVRQRDANLVPIVWQASHMTGHALTAAASLASSIMFYLAVAESNYFCYPYNEAVVVQDWTREYNLTVLTNEQIWYWNTNCYDPFVFSLQLFIGSVVWTSFFLIFGRGGTSISQELDQSKYFSDMIGQWQVVIIAVCFNCWYFLKSILISLNFTNGYLLFVATVSFLSTDNYFHIQFENYEKLYYIKTIVLLWCQSSLCTFNFLLTVYRCAMGVDFEVDFDDDDDDVQDDAMNAGPSNQTKVQLYSPWSCMDTSQ